MLDDHLRIDKYANSCEQPYKETLSVAQPRKLQNKTSGCSTE